MRSLLMLVAVGVAVAAVIWGLQRIRARPMPLPPARAAPPLPPTDGFVSERAAIAYGPDRGSGTLQLTPSQVLFTADSGRVVAIERLDITGASVTWELPDRTVAQGVLAISTTTEVFYFAVAAPDGWISRLN